MFLKPFIPALQDIFPYATPTCHPWHVLEHNLSLLFMTWSLIPFLPACHDIISTNTPPAHYDTFLTTIPPCSLWHNFYYHSSPISMKCSWPSPRYVITYHFYLLSSWPRPLPALYEIFLNTNPTWSPWHVPYYHSSLLSPTCPCLLLPPRSPGLRSPPPAGPALDQWEGGEWPGTGAGHYLW